MNEDQRKELRAAIQSKADNLVDNANRHQRRALTTQARIAQKRHEKHQKLRSSHHGR